MDLTATQLSRKETFPNNTVVNYTMINLHKKPWDPIWIMKQQKPQ